jgi:hypothetical protein
VRRCHHPDAGTGFNPGFRRVDDVKTGEVTGLFDPIGGEAVDGFPPLSIMFIEEANLFED